MGISKSCTVFLEVGELVWLPCVRLRRVELNELACLNHRERITIRSIFCLEIYFEHV